MSQRRRTTFRRYNLLLEVAALGLTSVILVAAVWFTLAEMNRNYLDLRLADAARVQVFLEGQLDDARASLARLADLPEAERSPSVLKLFADFSDIYSLDQQLRVERIYKSVPDTKVFAGFSFSGGKLGGYLRSVGAGTDASEIMRGHEDDAASVYFAIRPGGRLYLGRLNLAYVQDFLTKFSQFSGTTLMLVASDGFVMLSGDPGLKLAMFDLRKWAGPPTARRTLVVGDRRWIPMIAPGSAIGARYYWPAQSSLKRRRCLRLGLDHRTGAVACCEVAGPHSGPYRRVRCFSFPGSSVEAVKEASAGRPLAHSAG